MKRDFIPLVWQQSWSLKSGQIPLYLWVFSPVVDSGFESHLLGSLRASTRCKTNSWEDSLQSGRQGPTLHIARPVRAASLSFLLPPADLKWLIRLGESGNRIISLGDPGYIIAIICMQLSDLQRSMAQSSQLHSACLFLAPYETLQKVVSKRWCGHYGNIWGWGFLPPHLDSGQRPAYKEPRFNSCNLLSNHMPVSSPCFCHSPEPLSCPAPESTKGGS